MKRPSAKKNSSHRSRYTQYIYYENIVLNYFMVEHINQDRTKCFVLFALVWTLCELPNITSRSIECEFILVPSVLERERECEKECESKCARSFCFVGASFFSIPLLCGRFSKSLVVVVIIIVVQISACYLAAINRLVNAKCGHCLSITHHTEFIYCFINALFSFRERTHTQSRTFFFSLLICSQH